MIIFSGSQIYILTVILNLGIIIICNILKVIKDTDIPIAFYLSISNILIIAISQLIMNFII